MKKFVCSVCGYVYEGETAPDFCPICKAPKDKFVEQVGEMKLAAEHEFGIGTKLDGVPEEDKKFILDQLKANFSGECSEVGMYLCMARIAHREGYPEIGLYWEKAAYERRKVRRAPWQRARAEHDRQHEKEPCLARGVRIRRNGRQGRAGQGR